MVKLFPIQGGHGGTNSPSENSVWETLDDRSGSIIQKSFADKIAYVAEQCSVTFVEQRVPCEASNKYLSVTLSEHEVGLGKGEEAERKVDATNNHSLINFLNFLHF